MEKVATSAPFLLSISVVSHGQMGLIAGLMEDIQSHCVDLNIELILTLNLDEDLGFKAEDFFFPVQVIRNAQPKGFGANHNQAFQRARGQYFGVINPDIRFDSDPFAMLLRVLEDASVGVVAPLVESPSGELEDSVRKFPTPAIIWAKFLGRQQSPDYSLTVPLIEPDWVGGMFMVFPARVFRQLKGFDEAYFLYYEDVDLCGRLHLAGYKVAVCTACRVIHHARRSSHRSWKYLRWHLGSMLRFFLSPVYRQLGKRRVS